MIGSCTLPTQHYFRENVHGGVLVRRQRAPFAYWIGLEPDTNQFTGSVALQQICKPSRLRSEVLLQTPQATE